MNISQTYAWIFLSIPAEPARLQQVIATADAINHAIPTHKEFTNKFWMADTARLSAEGWQKIFADKRRC